MYAGELFAVVISIDALVGLNPRLGQGVRAYARLLGNMRTDPAKYGTDLASLDALERRVEAAERELCSGPLFPALIAQPFDVPGQLRVSGNKVFQDAVEEHIKYFTAHFGNVIGSPTETNQREQLMGLVGMLAFHTQLVSHGRAADKNLFKTVWGLMRRVPVLPVYGHACWRPLEFMIQMCPVKTRSMTPEVARTRQLEYAKQLAADLPREVNSLRLNACMWLPRFLSDLTNHPDKREVLSVRSTLMIHGLRLAMRLGQTVAAVVCAHIEVEVPITRATLALLLQGIELLSAVSAAFARRTVDLTETAMHAARLYVTSPNLRCVASMHHRGDVVTGSATR